MRNPANATTIERVSSIRVLPGLRVPPHRPFDRLVRALRLARRRALVVLLAALVAATGASVLAQSSPDAGPYPQEELDQLLAPIALYPDDLLVQILVASTYPLEVVEAARFVKQNPQLRDSALDDAVAQRNWDASVQSLTAFPQVLAMMDDKLEWTERLGDAFLSDGQRVMDTVQALRKRAEAAGHLASTPQQRVADDNGVIVIEPAAPDVVYVPVYDPLVVYGPWWSPSYPPWFWYPPPIYGYPMLITGVVFGVGWPIGHSHWGWGHADWHGRHVTMHVGGNRFWNHPNRPPPVTGQPWQHSPYHRRGVPYPNAQTRQQFQPIDPGVVRQRENFRGYAAPQPPARAPVVRGPQPATPPSPRAGDARPAAPSVFDPGLSREQARINAERGLQSLQTRPAAPVTRAPSAPAARPAMPSPAPRPAMPATAPRSAMPPSAPRSAMPAPAPRPAAPAPAPRSAPVAPPRAH